MSPPANKWRQRRTKQPFRRNRNGHHFTKLRT